MFSSFIKQINMSKTVLITGATGNLGKDVVQKLYAEGYKLFATLGSAPAPDYFSDLGVESENINLTDEMAVQQFAHSFIKSHPDLEAVVMMVGGFAPGSIEETSGASFDKMVALNFKTAFFITRPLLQYFKNRPMGGQFIFFGTRPALEAKEGKDLFAYALSKSLVFRLAECINESGKGKGVSATVVVPSTIDTPANRMAMPKADFSKWVKSEHIADAIRFVLSEPGHQLRDSVVKMYNES